MPISRLIAFVAVIFTLSGSAPASAGWINELGRDLGLGWSDGYHAYEGCPDPRHRSQPWQRRSERGGHVAGPLAPYLEPTPAAKTPAEALPPPKTSRVTTPSRSSQLHISRPHY